MKLKNKIHNLHKIIVISKILITAAKIKITRAIKTLRLSNPFTHTESREQLKAFLKQNLLFILIGFSFILGGIHIFLLGYKIALDSTQFKSNHTQQPQPTSNKIDATSKIQPTKESKPLMPMPDMSHSPISGSLTYANTLSIAKMYMRSDEFSQARVWIYRAYDIHNSKEVWELYLQSFWLDPQTSEDTKTQALELYNKAKKYYGF